MGKMTVYHGSYTAIEHPDIKTGRNTKDFGPGFYCTVIREQAQRWARRYQTPVLNTYTVRMDTSLNILEYRVMAKFKYPTHQINFCTPKALQCLEYVSGESVKD